VAPQPENAPSTQLITHMDDLPRSDGALFRDMRLPDGRGQVTHVIGHLEEAARHGVAPEDRPVVNQRAGYCVTYAYHEPGTGAPRHRHSAYETLIALDGAWDVTWYEGRVEQHTELRSGDTITAPPGMEVGFRNLTTPPGRPTATIISILGTDDPDIAYPDDVEQRLKALGL